MFDRTTNDCMLFSGSLNDLLDDCREVGYAREPSHELCDVVFQSNSSNGCYVITFNRIDIKEKCDNLVILIRIANLLNFFNRISGKTTVDSTSVF